MTAGDIAILRKYLGWCPHAPEYRRQQPAMGGAVAVTGEGGGDRPAGDMTGWIGRNGHAAVAITTGLCLIALTVVLKNVILVPADTLNRDIILYIIIYSGFIVSFTPVKDQGCPEMPERWPLFWCALSVLMTLAIIAVYAL